jgi:hypothetical protein
MRLIRTLILSLLFVVLALGGNTMGQGILWLVWNCGSKYFSLRNELK